MSMNTRSNGSRWAAARAARGESAVSVLMARALQQQADRFENVHLIVRDQNTRST